MKRILKKILPATYNKIDKRYEELLEEIIRIETRKTKPSLLDFEVQIVDHCNLNCAYCSHFSPISDNKYLDIKEYEKDIKRLSYLSNKEARFIKLMGGEPLLHPKIIDFMKTTRKYFPDTIIDIDTNGLLVLSMKDDFFNSLKKYNINLVITKYPIGIDYEKIKSKCSKYNVSFRFYDNNNEDRLFNKLPLKLEGDLNPEENFLKCYLANSCHTLRHGKMYTCSTVPYIEYFNKEFNKQIKESSKDSIDIYKVKSIDEILEFFARPIPFCRYCNIKGRIPGYKWSKSKKSINEWTDSNE